MVNIIHANSTGLGVAALSSVLGGLGNGVQGYQDAQANKQGLEMQERQMRLQERLLAIKEQGLQQDMGQGQASKDAAGGFLGRLNSGNFNQGARTQQAQALGDVGAFMAYRAAGIPKAPPGSIMDLRPGEDFDDPFQDPDMLKLFMGTEGADRQMLLGMLQARQDENSKKAALHRFSARVQASVQSGLLAEDDAMALVQQAQDDPKAAIDHFEEGAKQRAQARGRMQAMAGIHAEASQVISTLQQLQFPTGTLDATLGIIESALSDSTADPQSFREMWSKALHGANDDSMSATGQPMPSLGGQVSGGGGGGAAGIDLSDAPAEIQRVQAVGEELGGSRPADMPKPKAEPSAPAKPTDGDTAESVMVSTLRKLASGASDKATKRKYEQAIASIQQKFGTAEQGEAIKAFLELVAGDAGAAESSSYMPKTLTNQGATWRQR